jgi:hypothetical protein
VVHFAFPHKLPCLVSRVTVHVDLHRFHSSRWSLNQACGRAHAGTLDLYFETMAFRILVADHRAGHTLDAGKRHELRDFVDDEIPGNELTHEKSL